MAEYDNSNYDCMVIGAHPDDAELCCGGTIAKLTKEQKKVVLVDCTEGEMGTRGTNIIRLEEAQKSAKILGVKDRVNLGMPDGFVRTTEENLYKMVEVIRRFRPKIIIMHPWFERHPDHENVFQLVRDSLFKCGLKKFETTFDNKIQDVYRVRKIFSYHQALQLPRNPDFFVDISDVRDTKIEAIKSFASQVYVAGKYENESKTHLASPEFLEELEAKDRYFGSLCGVKYAEPFLAIEPLLLNSLSNIL